jgi:hypothetical protein
MQVQRVCVFDKDAGPSCDDGVTREITLPKDVKTYAPEPNDATNAGVRWVRRDALISVLRELARK